MNTNTNVIKQNANTLLSIRNLSVEYTSDNRVIHAVNDVSLDLQRGKTLGLVGETGAGKTSIAKSILRILPDPPSKITNGEILFEDEDIMKMDNTRLRSIRGGHISMIFQDPMTSLNPTMRIGKQIAEVIKLNENVNNREAEERARKMLEMVGISQDRYRGYPHQFSGGMKQRVIIAIALSCNPDLLLADEPTTALDVTIQAQVLDMINTLKKEKNTSMLLITHDLGIVAETCDDVAVVYAGELIEFGSKEEIFKKPSHPYTLGLFGALPNISGDEERLHPIDGLPPDPSDLPAGCKFASRCSYSQNDCSTESGISMVDLGGTHACRCKHINQTVIGKEG
jgi:peptide/nickel transport system ATP-binding protein